MTRPTITACMCCGTPGGGGGGGGGGCCGGEPGCLLIAFTAGGTAGFDPVGYTFTLHRVAAEQWTGTATDTSGWDHGVGPGTVFNFFCDTTYQMLTSAPTAASDELDRSCSPFRVDGQTGFGGGIGFWDWTVAPCCDGAVPLAVDYDPDLLGPAVLHVTIGSTDPTMDGFTGPMSQGSSLGTALENEFTAGTSGDDCSVFVSLIWLPDDPDANPLCGHWHLNVYDGAFTLLYTTDFTETAIPKITATGFFVTANVTSQTPGSCVTTVTITN